MATKRRKSLPGDHEKRLSRSTQVGLSIDSYDDLFSDFDPRSYKERQLSEDFLAELRRFFFDKNPESLDLVFLIPARRRSNPTEATIKRRLHIYFQKKNREIAAGIRHAKSRNWIKVAISVLLMVCTGYISTKAGQIVWMNIVKVIVEPASWFLFWTSLEQLLISRRSAEREIRYFHRLSECKIVFLSI
ncbi:MAG: hypothetical protein U1F27_03535 [Turneriella sp.]